jgi:hypothetical protein
VSRALLTCCATEPAGSTGLPRDSVVNVSQLLTLDRGFLTGQIGALPQCLQGSVDAGLRTVLVALVQTGGTSHRRIITLICQLRGRLDWL